MGGCTATYLARNAGCVSTGRAADLDWYVVGAASLPHGASRLSSVRASLRSVTDHNFGDIPDKIELKPGETSEQAAKRASDDVLDTDLDEALKGIDGIGGS